jgi:SGT1 protein
MTDDFLNLSDALKLVRDTSVETQAPVHVEQTVWQRIKELDPFFFFRRGNTYVYIERYPNNLSHHVHKAKAYLPVDIAKALSTDPALVQKAVEAFYTRDAAQLRVRIGTHVV